MVKILQSAKKVFNKIAKTDGSEFPEILINFALNYFNINDKTKTFGIKIQIKNALQKKL